jgi:hypothetical protein
LVGLDSHFNFDARNRAYTEIPTRHFVEEEATLLNTYVSRTEKISRPEAKNYCAGKDQ